MDFIIVCAAVCKMFMVLIFTRAAICKGLHVLHVHRCCYLQGFSCSHLQSCCYQPIFAAIYSDLLVFLKSQRNLLLLFTMCVCVCVCVCFLLLLFLFLFFEVPKPIVAAICSVFCSLRSPTQPTNKDEWSPTKIRNATNKIRGRQMQPQKIRNDQKIRNATEKIRNATKQIRNATNKNKERNQKNKERPKNKDG